MNNSRFDSRGYDISYIRNDLAFKNSPERDLVIARRTAFVARFIVLRETKNSHAHRTIELLEWDELTTAEELAEKFRLAFVKNQDNIKQVDRDLKRSLAHGNRTLQYFIAEYVKRATLTFAEALADYHKSNQLLFGEEEKPSSSAWATVDSIRYRKTQILLAPKK